MNAPGWCAQYVGIPFADRGRTRAGMDCWGLVRAVSQEQFGRLLPDYGELYTGAQQPDGPEAMRRGIAEQMAKGWERTADPQPGDVVILNVGGRPWHCGVIVASGWMLHSFLGCGVVLERLNSLRWCKRIEGFYRYAGN